MIKIRDEKWAIRTVRARFWEQYGHYVNHVSANAYAWMKTAWKELCRLDLHRATSEDVARAAGNKNWSLHYCQACYEMTPVVVVYGDRHKGDEEVQICAGCIGQAAAKLQERMAK